MKHFEATCQALQGETRLVVVCDQGAEKYAHRLGKDDPVQQPSRPTLIWQQGVGFIPMGTFPDRLPDEADWTEAITWIAGYAGAAIVVLDCGNLLSLVEERVAKRLLAQLRLKLVDRPISVVAIVASPLPQDFVSNLTYLGVARRAEENSPGLTLEGDPHDDWGDVGELSSFDTPEWEDRLLNMTAAQADSLLKQRAHLPAIDRINSLRAELRKRFESREKIIDALCCAAIAQVPTVLIGPPGTAKSALVRSLCEGLGLSFRQQGQQNGSPASRKYFEYMLTRFTTPEEIFGPWHINDLIQHQIYKRVTAGQLPEAQIAFLDEIFKASGAILNTLLTLFNERIFYNGGAAVRVPLVMAFAASNELPTDDSLKAMVDRFPLRILCPRVEQNRRASLIQRAWEQGYDRQFSAAGSALPQLACTNDLRLLNHMVRAAYGGRHVFNGGKASTDFEIEFLKHFDHFEDLVSDRTAPQLLSFARAHALLLSREGRKESGKDRTIPREALEVYRYISCDEQHQRKCDLIFRQAISRL